MKKYFNVTGLCIPEKHYMVDISSNVEEITETLVDKGAYFTMNRARQYGKTTTLFMLEKKLQEKYIVLSLSFEAADDLFRSVYTLTTGLTRRIGKKLKQQNLSEDILKSWYAPLSEEFSMEEFSDKLTDLCCSCDRDIVLMIDEVDKSSDNQVFLSFLGLLRTKYLDQQKGEDKTFKSVILAGVYDIKNLKLHPGREIKYNSPWNVAADFNINMALAESGIRDMLVEYERDHQTGMDVRKTASLIYDYTAGYPYLVSRICKLEDETVSLEKCGCMPWCEQGIVEAVKIILKTQNTLFDDMQKKLAENPDLKKMLYAMLFSGRSFPFVQANHWISVGVMFGFIREQNGQAVIANRIFETFFYDLFLSEDVFENRMYDAGLQSKKKFVRDGFLDMEFVLQKFMEYYTEIYQDSTEKFVEENGRRLFLIYLKPIINGTGNYYVESRTRSMGRTDIVVDYSGRQYVIELKIWHGNEYNQRGEKQLLGYLNDYHLKKGYMISFCFNKNKKCGKREIKLGDKLLIEVVV